MQPKYNSRFYLERIRMAARTFRKNKQQQSRVFFAVIWEKELEIVVKNERDEFCRKKTWKFKAALRQWEMLAASKVKKSGSEK